MRMLLCSATTALVYQHKSNEFKNPADVVVAWHGGMQAQQTFWFCKKCVYAYSQGLLPSAWPSQLLPFASQPQQMSRKHLDKRQTALNLLRILRVYLLRVIELMDRAGAQSMNVPAGYWVHAPLPPVCSAHSSQLLTCSCQQPSCQLCAAVCRAAGISAAAAAAPIRQACNHRCSLQRSPALP